VGFWVTNVLDVFMVSFAKIKKIIFYHRTVYLTTIDINHNNKVWFRLVLNTCECSMADC